MALPLIGALAGAAGNILGGIFGGNAGAADRGRANDARNIAVDIIKNIQAAPDQSKAQLWNEYKQQGLLTPEMEQMITSEAPEIAQYKDQADVLQAQKDALSTIGQRAKTGLTAEDRLALGKAREGAQSDIEAKREQILQNMAQRGLSGGGSELAAQLAASQAGAQTESDERAKIAAQASKAALEAALAQGQLSSNIRGQDYSQAANRSAAMSEMERFNVGNQAQQQARNVGAQNQAQQYNLTTGQNISNMNTQQSNAEIERQLAAQRQKYLDDVNLAKMKAGAYMGQADQLQQQGDQKSQQTQGMISGIGGAIGSIANSFGSQPQPAVAASNQYSTTNYPSLFESQKKYGSIA